jgi:nucleoid-associated protein YgaU
MHDAVAAGRPRCLAVAAALTAAIWGAAAVPVRAVIAGPPATTDEALVHLCLAALVVAAAWAWLQIVAGVADAWRGAAPGRGVLRRLAVAACGAALVGSLAGPAVAAPAGPTTHSRVSDPLAGLPLPERAEGGTHPAPGRVVVRTGDTLWGLAAEDLGRLATPRAITEHWHHLYAVNRAAIGPDPDLILPGQVLRLWKEQP